MAATSGARAAAELPLTVVRLLEAVEKVSASDASNNDEGVKNVAAIRARYEALCGRISGLLSDSSSANSKEASKELLERRRKLAESIREQTDRLKMLRTRLTDLDSALEVLVENE